jgi:hypothetical protein
MLALGLCTRLAASPIVVFLIVTDYERWRVGGFFWNKMGLEFTLLWTAAAFYFPLYGGGAISVDHARGHRARPHDTLQIMPPWNWLSTMRGLTVRPAAKGPTTAEVAATLRLI